MECRFGMILQYRLDPVLTPNLPRIADFGHWKNKICDVGRHREMKNYNSITVSSILAT